MDRITFCCTLILVVLQNAVNNVNIAFILHKTDPCTCITCDLLYCIRTSSIHTCINRREIFMSSSAY